MSEGEPVPSDRAYVSDIVSIGNDLPFPVTFKNGEDDSQHFTVAGYGKWDGHIWVPWVGGQGEMTKCIKIISPQVGDTVYMFQDYWHPSDKNQIKSCTDSTYTSGTAVPGESAGGGRKILRVKPGEGKINLHFY